MISPVFFFSFLMFSFFGLLGEGWGGRGGRAGGEGQKIAQDDKQSLSVALHISGTIHDMILINGTHV